LLLGVAASARRAATVGVGTCSGWLTPAGLLRAGLEGLPGEPDRGTRPTATVVRIYPCIYILKSYQPKGKERGPV
jgi:hypothetical protein